MLIIILIVLLVIGYLVWSNWPGGGGGVSPGPAASPSPSPSPLPPPSPSPPMPTRSRQAPGWVCALDLGTHAAKAAVWAPGQEPRVVAFGPRSTLPASVGIGPHREWIVGEEATNYAARYPLAVLRNPKGTVHRREIVLCGPDGACHVAPATLLGATLRALFAGAAVDAPPGPLREIVLTHPVGWTDTAALDVLREAVGAGGLPSAPVAFVTEPVAAAAWCACYHGDVTSSGAPFVVADIGGGSLDVAVLRRGQHGLEVLGLPVDDTAVAGNAVDAALLAGAGNRWSQAYPDYWQRLRGMPGLAWDVARHQCDDNARTTKEILAAFESTSLVVASPDGAFDLPVWRPEFVDWIANLLWATVRTIDMAVRSCGLDRATPVFLSGGSSRVWGLAATLRDQGFAVVDPDASGPAELVVVRGAALLSEALGRVPG